MADYISTINNNKFMKPRPDGTDINTIVITYSVENSTLNATKIMHLKGASMHYTIDDKGFQDQYHSEEQIAFYAGASSWKNISSVNNFGIGIMLINDANSTFPELQINKTISLIQDIKHRHNKTMDVVGLGEVNQQHIAPGRFFPWDKLAESGIGRHFTVPNNTDINCQISPDISDMQEDLQAYGYNVAKTGIFDDATLHAVQVFNDRYVREAPRDCWTDAAEYVIHQLLGTNHQAAHSHDEL